MESADNDDDIILEDIPETTQKQTTTEDTYDDDDVIKNDVEPKEKSDLDLIGFSQSSATVISLYFYLFASCLYRHFIML